MQTWEIFARISSAECRLFSQLNQQATHWWQRDKVVAFSNFTTEADHSSVACLYRALILGWSSTFLFVRAFYENDQQAALGHSWKGAIIIKLAWHHVWPPTTFEHDCIPSFYKTIWSLSFPRKREREWERRVHWMTTAKLHIQQMRSMVQYWHLVWDKRKTNIGDFFVSWLSLLKC